MEADAEEVMQTEPSERPEIQQSQDDLQVDNAFLDLESFTSTYTGVGLLTRLIFISQHAPQYSIEALRAAHAIVLRTSSVVFYTTIMERWRKCAAGRPDSDQPPEVSTQWVTDTKKSSLLLEERLDNDLKHFKANNIKESIRRCFDELGDFHMLSGNLGMAQKCYARSRDYCATSLAIIEMCLNIIRVNLYQQQYSHALSYVSRARQAIAGSAGGSDSKSVSASLLTKLDCSSGIAHLSIGEYGDAARAFLSATLDDFSFSEILLPKDVAVYGGLCAMATFSREELHQEVLSSATFKLFLELEPLLRDVLHKFHRSKFSFCLQSLESMLPNLQLDWYLSRHVKTLYSMIRKKALVQYFVPFQCVSLHKMAEVFNTDMASLEDEVASLILDGQIAGKIDSQEKVLYASDADQKVSTFSEAKQLGDQYHRSVQALVLRLATKKHHVLVSVKVEHGDRDAGMTSSSISRRRPHDF